jgi:dihydroorotase/N-acyl-D-amino-acid deacylase
LTDAENGIPKHGSIVSMAVILTNGMVIDGTAKPEFPADVLIEGNRISAVERHIDLADAERIDCSGLTVAPGFIDAHSHSDLQVLENRREKINQGVTTEVVGNCGFSAFPCNGSRSLLQEFANGIFCGGDDWGWTSAAAYLADVERLSSVMHVHALTGHGTLRVAHVGMRQGQLTSAEIDRMSASLGECLSAGSIGFSTGLMYAPGSSAPFEELSSLCAVVARHSSLHCTHMRSYSWDVVESTQEQLALARATGCRLQISHLKAVGKANWHKQEQVLEILEQARASGIDVEFDTYAYLAGSTVLTQLLPQSALEGGADALLARLTSEQTRKEIAAATENRLAQSWTEILITGVQTAQNQPLLGLTVAEIAERRGVEPVQAAIDLIIEEHAAVNMISFNQRESDLRALLTHPQCTVISDGFYVKGMPHPRLYGAFPEFLGTCSREKQWLTMSEAVHKVTAKPAERFGIKDRGVLRPGAYADITIFDPAKIGSPATYSRPEQPPTGIVRVLREGRTVVQNR